MNKKKHDVTTIRGLKTSIAVLQVWLDNENAEMTEIEKQYDTDEAFRLDYPQWIQDLVGVGRVINKLKRDI